MLATHVGNKKFPDIFMTRKKLLLIDHNKTDRMKSSQFALFNNIQIHKQRKSPNHMTKRDIIN